MSLVVFSQQSGSVIAFPDPALPATTLVRVEGFGGYQELRSVITSVTVSGRGNVDFLHSVGGAIHVYVFGDKIGQLTVSGLCFSGACEDGQRDLIGVERLNKFYAENRVAGRKTPLVTTIGAATPLRGYLIGVDVSLVDTKTRVWEFHLQHALIPPSSRKKDSGSEESEDQSSSEDTSPGEETEDADFELPVLDDPSLGDIWDPALYDTGGGYTGFLPGSFAPASAGYAAAANGVAPPPKANLAVPYTT